MDKAVDSVDNPIIMLIGEYLHTIDQKNRLSVPSKFRKELGNHVVLARGLDRCLFLFPEARWTELALRIADLPMGKAENRNFQRMMVAGAADLEIDDLGRILLPDYLRVYAGLKDAALIAGLMNRIEIWSPEAWRKSAETALDQLDSIAEKLGEAGLY